MQRVVSLGGRIVIQRGPVSDSDQAALTEAFGCAIKGCKYSETVITKVLALKVTLNPYVKREVKNLTALVGYATGGAEGEIDSRLDVLIRYNNLAGTQLVGFRAPTPETLGNILNWVDTAPGEVKPHLKTYAMQVSLETLAEIATSADDLYAVGRIINAGGGILGRNVSRATLPALKMALARFGPNSGTVPPSSGWGAGAEDSVEGNKEAHFRKHVLRLGNTGNPEPREPLLWKLALGLVITRDKITALVADEAKSAVPAYFNADGTDFLDESAAVNFYNVFLPTQAGAVNALLAEYGPTYYRAVEDAASGLARAVIGSDSAVTKVMGYAQLGGHNVFIAGRLDIGGTYSISSGYITLDDQLVTKNIGSIAWKIKG